MAKNEKQTKSKKIVQNRETCFVIMPFGNWFDDYYSEIFIPAIEAAGLMATRADDLYRPSAIVNDIWEYTKSAKIILAVLTGKNPNVFYELGLAHATAKAAILVTESIDDVPFDLRALRILEYNKNDPNWGTVLREQIEFAIKETLASPLSTVLPTFLNQPKIEIKDNTSDKEREIISLKQDVELLKREIRSGVSRTSRQGKEREVDIGPERARTLITKLLLQGSSDDEIIETVSDLGAPERWIKEQLLRMRVEAQKTPTSKEEETNKE